MMKKLLTMFLMAFLVFSVVSQTVAADANPENRLNYLLEEEILSNELLTGEQASLIAQLDNTGADVEQILTLLYYIKFSLEDSESRIAALIAEAQSAGLTELVTGFTSVQEANQELEQETDTLLDRIDNDRDGQHVSTDNCPTVENADQADADGDDLGDVCDANDTDGPSADADGDGILNGVDNCPNNANADQANTDNDSLGNVCDSTPNGETTPTLITFQQRYDSLESQFEDYEEDYDEDLKDEYEDAVKKDDENDIEDAEEELEELKDDLKELRDQAKDLEDEVEEANDDEEYDNLLDDIESLIEDITDFRNEVSALLNGESTFDDSQNDFDYVSGYTAPTTTTTSTPTGNVVEPLEVPELLLTTQEQTTTAGTQWESIRNMVLIAGGVVILLAIILFLIALLVR